MLTCHSVANSNILLVTQLSCGAMQFFVVFFRSLVVISGPLWPTGSLLYLAAFFLVPCDVYSDPRNPIFYRKWLHAGTPYTDGAF